MEQKVKELPIEEKGEWKNISLKKKIDGTTGELVKDGLGHNEYVIVTKNNYTEGREVTTQYGVSYSCGVEYNGIDVSFWLNEKEHLAYAACGGLADKIKILNLIETFVYKGIEKKRNVLHFEVVA